MKICGTTLTLLYIAAQLHAQSFDVHSIVMDKHGPLRGVLVYMLNNEERNTVTDSLGVFSFANLTAQDTLVFSHIGYLELHLHASLLIQQQKVKMSEKTYGVDDIWVFRNREFSSDFSIKTLGQLEIYSSSTSQADPLNAVLTLPASTNTEESAKPSLRGSSSGFTTVYINGVPIFYPTKGNLLQNSVASTSSMNTSLIETEHVYASNAPIEYENAAAGCVDMELNTKSNDKKTLFLSTIGTSLAYSKEIDLYGNKIIESYISYINLYPFIKINNNKDIHQYNSYDTGLHYQNNFKSGRVSAFSSVIHENGQYDTPYMNNKTYYIHDATFFNNIINIAFFKEWHRLNINISYSHLKTHSHFNVTDTKERNNFSYASIYYSLFFNQYIQGKAGINGIYMNYKNKLNYKGMQPDTYSYMFQEGGNMYQSSPFISLKLSSGCFSILTGGKYMFAKSKKPQINFNMNAKYTDERNRVLFSWSVLNMYNYTEKMLYRFSVMRSKQMSLEYKYQTNTFQYELALYKKKEQGHRVTNIMPGNYEKQLWGIEASFEAQISRTLSFKISDLYLKSYYQYQGRKVQGDDVLKYFVKTALEYKNPKLLNISFSLQQRPGTFYTPIVNASFDETLQYYKPLYSEDINSTQLNKYTNISLNISKEINLRFGKMSMFTGIVNILNAQNDCAVYYNEDYTHKKMQKFMRRSWFVGLIIHFL